MARQTPGWSVITGQSPESHLLGTAKESAWFSRGTFSREEGSSVRRQAPESGRSGRTSCFPEAVFATNVCPASRRSVSITALAESATNPRKRFDARSLEELAASFKTRGILLPSSGTRIGGKQVRGCRRSASPQSGETGEPEKLPVRVVRLTDAEAIEAQCGELSVVRKVFSCRYAARHVVTM
jgi:ParB-like nuclease domain